MGYIQVLGCFSASMTVDKHQSSQILYHNNQSYLIDCGESTQALINKYKIKLSSINAIFISHLHGDHYFGLPGLITTMNRKGRTKPLAIYGPRGLKEILTTMFKYGKSWTKFDLIINEISDEEKIIFSENLIEIETFKLNHRISCNAFKFTIKTNSNIFKYAYCSDTAYNPKIIAKIKNIDLLYHEATFLKEHSAVAIKTKHSTSVDAANIAKEANVKMLLMGHFSTRYKNLEKFKTEASNIFNNSHIAIQGNKYNF